MYWACLQRNKADGSLACSIYLDAWNVPAWFPQEANTDMKISMRKFIWRALRTNTWWKEREENKIRQREKLGVDSVSRKAIDESRGELWNYDGPSKWSQVVTRRAIPLYSHIDQWSCAGYLCLRQVSPVEGNFWQGLSLEDWQLAALLAGGAHVLQVWRRIWVGSSLLAVACSWKIMYSFLKIVLKWHSK